jgi:tetratricopeptide (TPR) repeat protein
MRGLMVASVRWLALLLWPGLLAAAPEADVAAFLDLYARAWSTLNPFELQRLAEPGRPVFRNLVESGDLDGLRSKSVVLEEVHVSAGRQAEFVEVHLNQTRGGLQSTVRLKVALGLVDAGGWLAIRSRVARSLPPPPALGTLADALGHLDRGEVGPARAALTALLPQLSGDAALEAQAHYELGLCERADGQHERAVERLKAALERKPTFPAAMNALAELELLSGKAQAARDRLKRSLEQEPAQPEVRRVLLLLNLALALAPEDEVARRLGPYLQGRAEAGPDLQLENLKGWGQGPEGPNLKALLLLGANQPDRAVEVLNKNLDRYPADNLARYLLGKAWLLTGQYGQAARELRAVGPLAFPYEDAPLLLALALEGTKNPKAALDVYEALLEKNAGDCSAHLRLGRLLLRLGHEDEGHAHLETVRHCRLDETERATLYHLMTDYGLDPLR